LYSNEIRETEKTHRANLQAPYLTLTQYMGPSIHNHYSMLRERSGKKDCEVSRVRGEE